MDLNKKWGTIKLNKLSNTQNLKRLKQCRYLFSDEPSVFLPTQLTQDGDDEYYTAFKNIDPIIVNTINLNKFLRNLDIGKSDVKFPEIIDEKVNNNNNIDGLNINITEQDCDLLLRDSISLICMFHGFEGVNSNCLDILVNFTKFYANALIKSIKEKANISEKPINLDETHKLTINTLRTYYKENYIDYFNHTYNKALKLNKKLFLKNNSLTSNRLTNASNDKGSAFLLNEEITLSNQIGFNDENSFLLNDTLLQEFGSVNADEEIDRLFQMIGCDPYSLISEEFQ